MKPNLPKFVAPILPLTLTAASLSHAAQSQSSSKSKSSKFHRLPAHYGKLKLKDEQIKEIYSIRETYGKKIAALQKELEDLREEQADKTKDVLTRTRSPLTTNLWLPARNLPAAKSRRRRRSDILCHSIRIQSNVAC